MLTLYDDDGTHIKKICSSPHEQYLVQVMRRRIELGTPPRQLFITENSLKPVYVMMKLDLEY